MADAAHRLTRRQLYFICNGGDSMSKAILFLIALLLILAFPVQGTI